jgi:hypothetical protein
METRGLHLTRHRRGSEGGNTSTKIVMRFTIPPLQNLDSSRENHTYPYGHFS